MTSPYKPVSWTEEAVSTDKLNQMTNNEQWLFENTPRMQYHAYSLQKFSGLKILATYAYMPPTTKGAQTKPVYFGSFFSVGCQPIVVATPVATNTQRRFHVAVNGFGRSIPDHTGCLIQLSPDELNPKNNRVGAAVYVNLIAIGW